MKILVVSADAETARALTAFFEGRGDEVTARRGGNRSFEGRTFGHVIIDLRLGAEALGLCRQARARDDESAVTVLVGAEQTTQVEAALIAGADEFLALPIEAETLVARISVIERSRAIRIERRALERRVETSRSRARTLLDAVGDGVLLVDGQGSIALANNRFSEITGFAGIDLLGEPANDFLRDTDGRPLLDAIHDQTAAGPVRSVDARWRTLEGGWQPAAMTAVPIPGEDGREEIALVLHAPGTLTSPDATGAHTALERDQAFFRQLFQSSPAGIVILDNDDRVVEANETFYRLFQRRPDEVAGQCLSDLIVPPELREEAAELSRAVFERRTVEFETVRMRSDGSLVDVSILGYPVELDDRRIGGFGIYSDIGVRKRAERQLFHEAFHDPLTRLPNRSLLKDRLMRAMRQGQRGNNDFALLFVDLDGFKRINDRHGHTVGDSVLVEVAGRLVDCLRPGDTIARFGGDEFMILLEALNHRSDAEHIAARILEALRPTIVCGDHGMQTAASIGIAHSDDGYESEEEVLRAADRALYRAKAAGKNRIEVAPPPGSGSSRLALSAALEAALEADQLQITYRPIAALRHGRLAGLAAAVSWRHPEQGLIAAPALRTICRQTGNNRRVLEWTLARVAADLASWQQAHPDRDGLLVHVESPAQIPETGFVERARAIIARSGAAPGAIILVLPVEDLEERSELAENLWALRDIGLRIGVGEVGLGGVPVRLLQHLPIDMLRLDPGLSRDLVLGSADAETIRALVGLAESLGQQLVAMGVDSEAARTAVERTGVRLAEGGAITGETDASSFRAWLDEGTAPLPAMPEDEATETIPAAQVAEAASLAAGRKRPKATDAGTPGDDG